MPLSQIWTTRACFKLSEHNHRLCTRLDLQIDALTKTGCDRIFKDHASGGRGDRVGMTDALSHLRAGATLMVWKLDRLGRSVRQLVEFTAQLEKLGIQFANLTDGIDTGSSAGGSSSTSWWRWPRWSGSSSRRGSSKKGK
ncbi:recombinase family protein [Caulobacter sp. AP07]|uniref:recombinase family protein n=1 Tax=Caulobacter sp. AP07 TaxID=1144304 RepID=UPI000689CF35|nr:recombinase family protein [Caulobacter sp. AP07]